MPDLKLSADEPLKVEVIELLKELVRLRSFNPPGDEAEMGQRVSDWLAEAGFEVERQMVTDGRANVVGRLRGQGQAPALVLCSHLDTVPPGDAPWSVDPLGAEVRDGRLYGRGSADPKGALAAMLVAARRVRSARLPLRGDLLVLATVDEETNGLGARTFLESGGMRGVGAIVIGEPTSLDMVVAHRGALWLELTTWGKPAHGAMPERGINAVLPMAAILSRLASHAFLFTPDPLLAPPTLNVGTIHGGAKINMVPDRCQAAVDIRTVPGQSHDAILADVHQLAETVAVEWPGLRVEVRAINDKPPLATATNHPFITAAEAVSKQVLDRRPVVRGAPFLTDGALLAGTTGTPALVYGPGQESQAHQADEFVTVDEVVSAVHFYAGLVSRVLT